MKAKVKKLYEAIKNYKELADEICDYSFDKESDFWVDVNDATQMIGDAIDLIEDALAEG